MLPIIFGTGPRQEVIDEGEFDCPHCQVTRRYERKSVQNYFRLYFIPLVPFGDKREIVQCTVCGNSFAPDVLQMRAQPTKRAVRPLAQQLNTLAANLKDGKPVEYALAELTAAGLDHDLARENVNRVIGDDRATCPTCGLNYAPGVATCYEDQTPLEATPNAT